MSDLFTTKPAGLPSAERRERMVAAGARQQGGADLARRGTARRPHGCCCASLELLRPEGDFKRWPKLQRGA
jgi:hypothetical protein